MLRQAEQAATSRRDLFRSQAIFQNAKSDLWNLVDLVTNFVFLVVWIFSLSETLIACAYLCISVKSQKSTEVEEKRRELLKMQALPLPRDQPFDEDEQDEQLLNN